MSYTPITFPAWTYKSFQEMYPVAIDANYVINPSFSSVNLNNTGNTTIYTSPTWKNNRTSFNVLLGLYGTPSTTITTTLTFYLNTYVNGNLYNSIYKSQANLDTNASYIVVLSNTITNVPVGSSIQLIAVVNNSTSNNATLSFSNSYNALPIAAMFSFGSYSQGINIPSGTTTPYILNNISTSPISFSSLTNSQIEALYFSVYKTYNNTGTAQYNTINILDNNNNIVGNLNGNSPATLNNVASPTSIGSLSTIYITSNIINNGYTSELNGFYVITAMAALDSNNILINTAV